MNRTEPQQIQPAIEHLHKDAKDIRNKQAHYEEENRELHKTLVEYQEVTDKMELKLTAMVEDGSLKMTEADVSGAHASSNSWLLSAKTTKS